MHDPDPPARRASCGTSDGPPPSRDRGLNRDDWDEESEHTDRESRQGTGGGLPSLRGTRPAQAVPVKPVRLGFLRNEDDRKPVRAPPASHFANITQKDGDEVQLQGPQATAEEDPWDTEDLDALLKKLEKSGT
eukprot:TRINITY_DN72980_c0_g1_i1.p3 TRINITY_DN72980_c0_g1~~TRINITY_DN72980_c0_g1_i1.p3  ORF type:complete len:151 (+),score=40.33 TRINITY_DN72980_c0_g1_i1:55-453(+)